MTRVLITGGSGFLGRRIVSEAQAAGCEVFAPRSVEANLESGAGVREYFETRAREGKAVQAVIHSAAHYGGINMPAVEALDLAARNLKMAAVIFTEAARANVAKIVSVGSTCAYPGNIPDADMKETDIFSGRCHESVEAYGFSKRAQLVLMAAARKQHGISCSQIALTNLYGEHDVFHEYRAHAIAALIKKIVDAKQQNTKATAWGSGKPLRQFLYVGDAANVIVRALAFPHDDLPINAGGAVVSIRELAHTIADIAGLPREDIVWDSSRPDGVARKVVDESKLRTLLPDYAPMSFKDGLQKTIHWYMENQEQADARR